VEAIKKRLNITIDWINLPLDDIKTFELLNQGKTLGVFQMESGGMQDLAKNLHLDKFEEIIAVVSLYRPGPMEMIPSFIERKKGLEPIEIEHPWMEDILKETYGIMVYQEQVMQIASKLANYSLGEGDILRRAMGKKELDKMAQQREKFKKGCLDNGISEEISMAIFDKMEKFASYGFNKSHAAAYAYITYVSAYLKANYPKDWMASLMTCDAHDISKVAKFIGEAKSMGIEVLSPDINDSERNFFATDEGIRFAMGGIKGLGNGVVDAILEERAAHGRFKNFQDFLKRIDLKKMGKKSAELLVDAGCFSKMGWTKDQFRISIEPMMEQFAKEQKESSLGIMNLFEEVREYNEPPPVLKQTPYLDELFKEKELIGFFLTGHPLELYKEKLVQLGALPLSNFSSFEKGTHFRTAFLIDEVKIRFASKTQKKFAILTISDESGERFELPIWPDLFEEKGHLLLENRLMAAILQVEEEKLSCRWIDELTSLTKEAIEQCDRVFDKAREQQKYRESKGAEKKMEKKVESHSHAPLLITVELEKCHLSHLLKMKTHFRSHPGKSPVEVKFVRNGSPYATLHISDPWGVENNKDLLNKLKEIQSII
jgi:DNA polymerase-3 subunit alpha